MAEKKEEKKGGEKKPKRRHLVEIRTRQARDGSLVHHHTYMEHPDAMHEDPERGPMATSESPEEAGQHVNEQFGMNQMGEQPEPQGGQAEAPEEV